MMAKNIGGGAEEMGRKMNTFAHSFNKYCWRNSTGSTLEQSNGPWPHRPSLVRTTKRKEKQTRAKKGKFCVLWEPIWERVRGVP